MTALLTDNLPLLAGASNGIKKLREVILEQAVRGKLVPQDRTDEPASELLKRIGERKAQLVAEGKIKKQKALAKISDKEKPFNLPTSWEWVRLGQLGLVGSSSRVHQKDWQSSGVPFYRAREIVRLSRDAFVENELFISEELYQELSRKESVPRAGDIMLTGVGTIGVPYCVQEGDRFYFKDASVLIFKNHIAENSNYLLKYFFSPCWVNTIHATSMGTTVHTLTIARANETLCPLPPLAEQHRIVAKVDELMALCDRLEAQQADADSAHIHLVQVLLDNLTRASDATDFADNWHCLSEHFHTLFTTELSIDALKQTLLQLAVMGKLVPQEPNDEPASELLKRIAEERTRCVASRRSTMQAVLPSIADTEKAFRRPSGWEWIRLQQIVSVSSGDGLISANMKPDGGIPVYGGNGVTGYHDKKNVNNETLVIGRVGYYCGSIHITPAEAWITDNALIVRFSEENIYKPFLFWLLKGTNLKKQENATAQPVISGRKIYPIVLAIPPLAEQRRIVAKIEELMAFCDQLKVRLTRANQLNEQLAITMVGHALAEDCQEGSVAPDQKAARTLLAAEVTHRLHAQRTFGQRKLQKVVYLAEHAARLNSVQGSYLRNVAGPHDRQLMNQIEAELQMHKWYERIDRDTVGHAYRPLSQAGQHRQAYNRTWSAEQQANIEKIIELMRNWDTDRCEMTVTLYAVWNDFIIESRPVTDEAIVHEVMHRWNEAKLRFSKGEWLAVLTGMKKHVLLTPTGFGRRTSGGTLTLPGFE